MPAAGSLACLYGLPYTSILQSSRSAAKRVVDSFIMMKQPVKGVALWHMLASRLRGRLAGVPASQCPLVALAVAHRTQY